MAISGTNVCFINERVAVVVGRSGWGRYNENLFYITNHTRRGEVATEEDGRGPNISRTCCSIGMEFDLNFFYPRSGGEKSPEVDEEPVVRPAAGP